jgi:hypothetical protein
MKMSFKGPAMDSGNEIRFPSDYIAFTVGSNRAAQPYLLVGFGIAPCTKAGYEAGNRHSAIHQVVEEFRIRGSPFAITWALMLLGRSLVPNGRKRP